MASYRPKSLDELNNLYGKAVSAEKAIKEGSTLLGEEVLPLPAPEEEKAPAAAASAPQTKVESVSSDIDAFIRRFSSEDGRPVPLSRLTPQPAEAEAQKPQPQKEEGITGLMDDYANVMTGAYDDEEEEEPKKNLFKQRRGKRKASKEITANTFEPREYEQAEAENFIPTEQAALHTGASLFEKDDSAVKSQETYPPQDEIPDGADDEANDVPYEREEAHPDDFEFGEISSPAKLSGTKRAAKAVLAILLVLILLATAATGACVLTVNSGKEVGSYRIYTVESADIKSGITADDLVFCKKSELYQKDENVVYYDMSGNRAVGRILIANGNGTYNINISDVQQERIEGVAEKSIASLGKIAKLVSQSFMVILFSLVAFAIIITLLLCFVFKPKEEKKAKKQTESFEDGESPAEAEPEHDDNELFSGIE